MDNKEGEAPAASNETQTLSNERQTSSSETPPAAPLKKEPQTHWFHLPPLKDWFHHLPQSKQPEEAKNPGPPPVNSIHDPVSSDEKDRLK